MPQTTIKRLGNVWVFLCALLALGGTVTQAQVNVLTQHNNNSRTGTNLKETILKPSNVNKEVFGKLFTRAVDGEVYAQPLIVSGVTIPGKGVRNVVYVATMNNTLYAYDADDANETTPFWKVNFGTPVPASDVQCCCTDISVRIGILSTPVIDPTTNTIYLVSRNKMTDGSYRQRLHALDITTGAAKFGGETIISAQDGNHTFDPRIQNQRAALTLSKGVIYIAWASHNDCGDYSGWVMGYRASTLKQVAVYSTTPFGWGAGIWMSGQGLTVDAQGSLYLMTGNGTFDADKGGANYGCSFLKLTVPTGGGLKLSSWFTPFNVDGLNAADADLGSAGVLGIPGTNYIVRGGKQGVMYLLDTAGLGGFQAGSDSQIHQSWQATNGHIHGSPIYYDSPKNGKNLFIWSEHDTLKVFKFDGNTFNPTPIAQSSVAVAGGMPGAMLSISANGKTTDSGIIWASHPLDSNANNAVVTGLVRAFDANTIVLDGNGVPRLKELWNTQQNAKRDDIGMFGKYCPPTIANGKVYMASFGARGSALGSGQLVVYGLLPVVTDPPPPPTALAATPGNIMVRLGWKGSTNATGYKIYRGLTSNGQAITPIATTSGTSYNDTNVYNNKTYFYKVSAYNTIGESGRSNEASARPAYTFALSAIADAYTASGTNANVNFGTATDLQVKEGSTKDTRTIYIRFPLSGFLGNITRARLRLYGGRPNSAQTSRVTAYAVSDIVWKETSIKANNQPTLGEKLGARSVTNIAQYYEWDVSNYVLDQQHAGASKVSFALKADRATADAIANYFNSKEAVDNPPQLAVIVTNYPHYPRGFAGGGGMGLTGSAQIAESLLRITNGGGGQAGSGFFNTKVGLKKFTNTFRFQITNPDADGFTFTFQNASSRALGAQGGGLGYGPDNVGGNAPNIPRSVAIKFDIYNNQGEGENSTGIYSNGVAPTVPSIDLNGTGINLKSGGVFEVSMTYDGITLKVAIRDINTNATANQSYTVDIPGTLKYTTGYVGFTGGTGGLTAIQDILSWTMTP